MLVDSDRQESLTTGGRFLIAAGDPLERSASLVDFEVFWVQWHLCAVAAVARAASVLPIWSSGSRSPAAGSVLIVGRSKEFEDSGVWSSQRFFNLGLNGTTPDVTTAWPP